MLFSFFILPKNVIVGLLQKQDAGHRSASLISKIKHAWAFLFESLERKEKHNFAWMFCLLLSCSTNKSARCRKRKEKGPAATDEGWNSPRDWLRFVVWFCLSSASGGTLSNAANEKRSKVESGEKHPLRPRFQCRYKITGARELNRNRRASPVYVDSLGKERSPLCRTLSLRPSYAFTRKLVQDIRD